MQRILSHQLPTHLGATVTVAGWVHRRRLFKSVAFLILRDTTGLTQVVVTDPATRAQVEQLTEESVVAVTGTVALRAGATGAVTTVAATDGAVGADQVEWLVQPGPYTAMGWNIEPQGLVDLLLELHERYPSLPLAITENGAAFYDTVTEDGRVHDEERVAYLHDHIDAVGAAIDAGADVRGYFAWSLLDNFEWGYGYDRRFGIIRVDYETLERTWKDSAHWYRRLASTSVLPGVDEV